MHVLALWSPVKDRNGEPERGGGGGSEWEPIKNILNNSANETK
jgi:hypothetical protein